MYVPPSRRKYAKRETTKPNLIPILDAVFIFVFFLLMTATFIKVYEIPSDVPIVSDEAPKKEPFTLSLIIDIDSLILKQGLPGRTIATFSKNNKNEYDLNDLRNRLIQIKKRHKKEKTIIFEPKANISYEELVRIMDAVRLFRRTDETLFMKDKAGVDIKIRDLFSNIIFGNIQS